MTRECSGSSKMKPGDEGTTMGDQAPECCVLSLHIYPVSEEQIALIV